MSSARSRPTTFAWGWPSRRYGSPRSNPPARSWTSRTSAHAGRGTDTVLEKVERPDEVRRWEGRMPVSHRYTPGVAGDVFFTALRDRGVLLGSRCDSCDYTYAPARLFCERCFAELSADAEVGPGGLLLSFTISYTGLEGEPLEQPVTIGLVQLDGADAA